MSTSDTISIIQDIAEITGLSTLAVETGLLLLITFLFLVVLFVVVALLRIRKEMIKFNLGAGHLARLLTMATDKRKVSLGYFDFRVDEWKEDTKFIVLEMMQQGKSNEEITKVIDVSPAYINEVRKWALKKGILFKKSG